MRFDAPDTRERARAAAYLARWPPRSVLHELRAGRFDPVQQHFGLGLAVRNALRGGGFHWDDVAFDEAWFDVAGEAARMGTQEPGPQNPRPTGADVVVLGREAAPDSEFA